jgi:hypothetical protein
MKIAKRSGTNKARVTLARKLAVIMHGIWRRGEQFCWLMHEIVARGRQRNPYSENAVTVSLPSGARVRLPAESRPATEGSLHELVVDIKEPALWTG